MVGVVIYILADPYKTPLHLFIEGNNCSQAQLSPSPSCAELKPYSQLFTADHPTIQPPDRESLAKLSRVL